MPRIIKYWSSLIRNSLRVARYDLIAKEVSIICVIELEDITRPSATVNEDRCCNCVISNLCDYANKKSIKTRAMVLQSSIETVLKRKILLFFIIPGRTKYSHLFLMNKFAKSLKNHLLISESHYT